MRVIVHAIPPPFTRKPGGGVKGRFVVGRFDIFHPVEALAPLKTGVKWAHWDNGGNVGGKDDGVKMTGMMMMTR